LRSEEPCANPRETRVIRPSPPGSFRKTLRAMPTVNPRLKITSIKRLHNNPHTLRNRQRTQKPHKSTKNRRSSPADTRPHSTQRVGDCGEREREGEDAAT